MISEEYKLIFIHIPKTGGASFEHIIWPDVNNRTVDQLWMGFEDQYHNRYQTGGLQHLKAFQILNEIGINNFSKFYKFSMVRNPWDRIISQFFYMKNRKDLRDFIGMSINDSFKKYLNLITKKNHVQWEEQYKFVYDKNGDLMTDYIGRFETFEDSIRTALLAIDFRKNLNETLIPHKLKGSHDHYSFYYDSESEEMVSELFRKDIELFGYKFK